MYIGGVIVGVLGLSILCQLEISANVIIQITLIYNTQKLLCAILCVNEVVFCALFIYLTSLKMGYNFVTIFV